MRRVLTVLGKFLILLGLMWPVPFGFIMYPLFGYKINMPMWGIEAGYWWPLLGIMAIGIIMCLLANYRTPPAPHKLNFKSTLLYKIVKYYGYGLLAILGFYLLVLLVVGLHRILFTPLFDIAMPILMGTGIVVFLLSFGFRYYKERKKEE